MNFRIILPEGKTYYHTTESIIISLPDGLAGIMKGHSPMLAELSDGTLQVRHSENPDLITLYQITNGFIEVLDNQITVLADTVVILSENSHHTTVI